VEFGEVQDRLVLADGDNHSGISEKALPVRAEAPLPQAQVSFALLELVVDRLHVVTVHTMTLRITRLLKIGRLYGGTWLPAEHCCALR
jgi:hypothetical protein